MPPGAQGWAAPSAGAAALFPEHKHLQGRTAQARLSPPPGFHGLGHCCVQNTTPAHTELGHVVVAPGQYPPHTRPPLTAEPLWPASPRSPGMPTSPYTQGKGETEVVGRFCALG